MSFFFHLLAGGSEALPFNEYRLTKASSESIELPNGSDINFERTNSFTASALVKFKSGDVGQFVPILSKTDATGLGWLFYKDNTEKIYFNVRGTAEQWAVNGSTVFAVDKWYLITICYAGVTNDLVNNRFYVNGGLETLTNVIGAAVTTSIVNTGSLSVGSRAFSPIYSSLVVGAVGIWNVQNVNIHEKIWNHGKPIAFNEVTGCVRYYDFRQDTYSGSSYTVVGTVGVNGSTTNMSGNELVLMNSVEISVPQDVFATPRSSTENSIYWTGVGKGITYDVEVSNDGSTGWSTIASNLATTYYHHNVGLSSTLRYYRVTAKGSGINSAASSNVSATTLSSSYSTTRYFSTRKRGDNSYNFGLSVETLRVAPGGYYDSITNKTYFAYMSRAEYGYDMAPYVYYFDHASQSWSESYYVGLKTRGTQDRHPMPSVMVSDTGYIFVCATDIHYGPFQLWRSDSAGNVSNFTRLAELGTQCDYPEFRKMTNGDIYIFCRNYIGAFEFAAFGYFKSTDDGATWSSLLNVFIYANVNGRPYPTLAHQPNSSDRIHMCLDIRDGTDSFWESCGYLYTDDGITWRNAGNTYSRDIVASGHIREADWPNFQFLTSIGTVDSGLSVGVVTPSGQLFASHYKDDGTYNVFYHNGTSWVTQPLTFPDSAPDFFTFGYQGIQVIRHITGDTFDIYATKTGLVKRYRTIDKFVTLTLEDANVLPTIGSIRYERGTMTHNIYECAEPFLFYSLKVSVPTPLETSPGAWSDIVLKKIT